MELVRAGQGPLSHIIHHLAGRPVDVPGHQVSGWENYHREEYQGIQCFVHSLELLSFVESGIEKISGLLFPVNQLPLNYPFPPSPSRSALRTLGVCPDDAKVTVEKPAVASRLHTVPAAFSCSTLQKAAFRAIPQPPTNLLLTGF